MKIVFMGTPIFAATVLEGLIKKHDVIGIVTQIDKKAHRGKLIYSPVKELALKHDIKLLQLASIKKEYQEVINLKPDLIVPLESILAPIRPPTATVYPWMFTW